MDLLTILLVTFGLKSFHQSHVIGHRVLGLRNYAEDVCTQTMSTPAQTEQELELCKYKFLGILRKDGNLVEAEQMAFILGYIFGESIYNNGLDLAKQIHDQCNGLLKSIGDHIASERGQPFFECVSKIIKIDSDGERDAPQMLLATRITSKVAIPPDEKIYPDLTCHQGYNSDRSVPGTGEAYLVDIYQFCKYDRDPNQNKAEECYKICMAEHLGLIDTTYYGNIRTQWNRYGDMVNYLRQLLVGHNTANGKALATKILDACRQKIKLVETHRTNPCHTTRWRDFFKCVDSVWDCRQIDKSSLRNG